MSNDVNKELRKHLKARAKFGQKKYGVTLTPWNGRNSLKDVREEILDTAVYLTQAIMEREDLEKSLRAFSETLRDAVESKDWDMVSNVTFVLETISTTLGQDIPRIEPKPDEFSYKEPMQRLEEMR